MVMHRVGHKSNRATKEDIEMANINKVEAFSTGGGIYIAMGYLSENIYVTVDSEYDDVINYFDNRGEDEDCPFCNLIRSVSIEWDDDVTDLDKEYHKILHEALAEEVGGAVPLESFDYSFIPFDTMVEYMDDDIREELHRELAPCTDAEFLEAYKEKHLVKFGETFTLN